MGSASLAVECVPHAWRSNNHPLATCPKIAGSNCSGSPATRTSTRRRRPGRSGGPCGPGVPHRPARSPCRADPLTRRATCGRRSLAPRDCVTGSVGERRIPGCTEHCASQRPPDSTANSRNYPYYIGVCGAGGTRTHDPGIMSTPAPQPYATSPHPNARRPAARAYLAEYSSVTVINFCAHTAVKRPERWYGSGKGHY